MYYRRISNSWIFYTSIHNWFASASRYIQTALDLIWLIFYFYLKQGSTVNFQLNYFEYYIWFISASIRESWAHLLAGVDFLYNFQESSTVKIPTGEASVLQLMRIGIHPFCYWSDLVWLSISAGEKQHRRTSKWIFLYNATVSYRNPSQQPC